MFSLTKTEAAQIWPELELLWLDQVNARVHAVHANDRPTVLVVDDDDDVRDYTAAILRGVGYRVVAAASPSEALHRLRDAPAIDLMVTDIVLPEIDGFKLAELAKRRHPAMRVLYTSGYPDSVARQPTERYGRLLAKPYRSAQLEQAVHEAATQRPSRDAVFR